MLTRRQRASTSGGSVGQDRRSTDRPTGTAPPEERKTVGEDNTVADETRIGHARRWVLAVLADADDHRLPSEEAVLETIAVRFADRFAPVDRTYDFDRGSGASAPTWHEDTEHAIEALRQEALLRGEDPPALTEQGVAAAETAKAELAALPAAPEPAPLGQEEGPGPGPLLTPGVVAMPLRDPEIRRRLLDADDEQQRMPVMVELNLRHHDGVGAAFERLADLWQRVTEGQEQPRRLADEYATGRLSMAEIKRIVSADAVPRVWQRRAIHRIWPDFPVHEQVDASAVTVKADASQRSFNCFGERIVWAVVDSGIAGDHPHFLGHETLTGPEVDGLHRAFPADGDPTPEGALTDESGHGTHVAGIIAGGIQPWLEEELPEGADARVVHATENRYNAENSREPLRVPRSLPDPSLLAGIAPKAKLVSLKVLQRGGTLEDRVSRVIAALAYVREVNGQSSKLMRIHGVNLSVGYDFDAQWFACGHSALCQEVDKLVRTGVVVVVAAGNSGYGSVSTAFEAPTRFGLAMTINDPGNAQLAITVGSTHRDMPHTYGVSYFSSKGPTGDGRRKPDLVAPGERITSCAAGDRLRAVIPGDPPDNVAVYVEETGTSMAAPHVSGAAAAFLSVRREFIGKPDAVKDLLVRSATPLGREQHFEGGGLLDLMRALQAV
jgi:serine protease AprX